MLILCLESPEPQRASPLLHEPCLTCPYVCRITNVFYEQYLTIVPEGLFMLTMCLLPTFVVCYLLLGMDLRSGLLNLFCIIMILVDTVGFMTLWGITYNAVSLINLVTVSRWPGPAFQTPHSPALADMPLCPQAVGISVEFVSHITRSFAVSTEPSRLDRAREATVSMGSAVSEWHDPRVLLATSIGPHAYLSYLRCLPEWP